MLKRDKKLYERAAIIQADASLTHAGLPTYSQLIEAIRRGNSIDDLKRLVGPSDEERDAAIRRLTALDKLANACKWGEICPDWQAQQARERWHQIDKVQGDYENQYC